MLAQREAIGNNLAEIRRLKLNKAKIDKARDQLTRIPDDIQVRVAMLFIKDIRALSSKSKKVFAKVGGAPSSLPTHQPSKSIQQPASYSSINDRITGNNKKRALVRGNLMGKRLEHTGRTVITPNPTLRINELGVPLSMCMDQTFKETVTHVNIQWLRELVATGPDVHPGAVAVWKIKRQLRTLAPTIASTSVATCAESLEKRDKICLRTTTREFRTLHIRLRVGDVVERHLQNGDVVLFNRQPSLHRNSLLAHLLRVTLNSTFEINPAVCTSYNADFDGDEMNLHTPQTQDARADARELLLVDHNICSPQTGRPVVTALQDMVDVMFRLSSPGTFLPKTLFCDMMCGMDLEGESGARYSTLPEPAIWVRSTSGGGGDKETGTNAFQTYWTGAQLVSLAFPPRLNYTSRKKAFLLTREDWDDPILDGSETHIRHGQFCCGWMVKKVVNHITEILFKTCGSRLCPLTQVSAAGAYLTRVSRLTYHYSLRAPSTIGIRDVAIHDPALKQAIQQITAHAVSIIARHADNLSELEIARLCQKVINYVGDRIVKSQSRNCSQMTNLIRAIVSGARGSLVNIVQIMGCLGQQHVEGQRIAVYGPEGRTLPFFPRNTSKKNLVARGLIAFSCFLTGLSPKEFIFHMMGGREGLISTAIKTAQSGYCTRKLTTVMKAVIKRGSVWLGSWMFALHYYGDGLDPSRLTDCLVPELFHSSAQLIVRYARVMPVQYLDYLVHIHEKIARIKSRSINWTDMSPRLELFYDLVPHFATAHGLWTTSAPPTTTPADRAGEDEDKEIDPWMELKGIHSALEQWGIAITEVQAAADLIALGNEIQRLHRLSSTSAYRRHIYTSKWWKWVRHTCLAQASRTQAADGEQIANAGATSMGERTTQLTLDTFHHAGDADVIGAGGLHRLNEVMNVTPTAKMHHTSMRVSLGPMPAHNLSHKLVATCLHQVAQSIELESVDKHPCDAAFETIWYARYAVSGMFSNFYAPVKRLAVNTSKRKGLPLDGRVYRIVLDKSKCRTRGQRISAIAQIVFQNLVKFFKKSPSRLSLTHSEPWMDTWVIRIRFIAELGIVLGDRMLKRAITRPAFRNLIVSGVSDITHAFVASDSHLVWNDATCCLSTETQSFVCTTGTNLVDLLRDPCIDPMHTWSNSIRETETTLGIMAAQQVVANEARAVLSFNGSFISPRHPYLLAQTMTHYGFVCPVSRYGLAQMDASPLLRMSFEEGRTVMEQAARHSSIDRCEDITACIILGQKSDIGSGGVQILPTRLPPSQPDPGTATPTSTPIHALFYDGTTIQDRKKKWKERLEWLRTKPARDKASQALARATHQFLGIEIPDDQHSPNAHLPPPNPAYHPESPGPAPSSPLYHPGSPGPTSSSPLYHPGSPGPTSSSPLYHPESPGPTSSSPLYHPGSPGPTSSSPLYHPESPGFAPSSPLYHPESPGPTSSSPLYHPESPKLDSVFSFFGVCDSSSTHPSQVPDFAGHEEEVPSEEDDAPSEEEEEEEEEADTSSSGDFSEESEDENIWD